MPTFDSARPSRPITTMVIPPSAFAEGWERRPTAAIAVGLRLLSELDAQIATRDGATSTVKFLNLAEPGVTRLSPEDENDIYLSRIMGMAIARSVCDPNDILKMHDDLPALEDHVFRYFTPAGIKLVFEALQLAGAQHNPLSPTATDEDLALLVAHLQAGTIAALPRAEQLAIRRLLGCALEPLRVKAPGLQPEAGESDHEIFEDGEADYDLTLRA
jgi:hypothetical protein